MTKCAICNKEVKTGWVVDEKCLTGLQAKIRKETAKSIAKDLMQKVVFLAEGRFIPVGCVEDILDRYTKG